ncbi:uncharacterized protein AB675_8810 [Cyphellophora attinorum]|uniref:Uncharacterized protein n=1 Tax=Cyphellophora attinorum TaxID=1664694 RepID=A0A0N1HA01_9EURO|nr:uncharacterized protein AB675_8810 [Phialophora attinorum]KPI44555.1 hypothetical protein AB675_8810 [Phialophora attinorum]
MSGNNEEYWLPGYGLSRHIVFRQLQYFIGPSATVRPFSYHGREGYLIKGAPLTKKQIEDLRKQSEEYEKQQSLRMSGRRESSDDSADINTPIIVSNRGRGSSYRPYR